jgi:hypothetical protein
MVQGSEFNIYNLGCGGGGGGGGGQFDAVNVNPKPGTRYPKP